MRRPSPDHDRHTRLPWSRRRGGPASVPVLPRHSRGRDRLELPVQRPPVGGWQRGYYP